MAHYHPVSAYIGHRFSVGLRGQNDDRQASRLGRGDWPPACLGAFEVRNMRFRSGQLALGRVRGAKMLGLYKGYIMQFS